MEKIKTINDPSVNREKILEAYKKYKYQEELTPKLDAYTVAFDQNIINEIVLWKVDRYACLHPETLTLINEISPNDTEINEVKTADILEKLLATSGIRLAMASTILRFRNPNIYQIIDQRVYRFLGLGNSLSKV